MSLALLDIICLLPWAILFLAIAARYLPGTGLGRLFRLLDALVNLLTFPGIIVRNVCRKLCCDLAGVQVLDVKYFSTGSPPGYVLHGKANRYRDIFLITIGPFALNTALAIAAFIPACFGIGDLAFVGCLWVGAAFALHALPDQADAQSFWRRTKRELESNPAAFLGYPLALTVASPDILRGRIRVNLLYTAALYSLTFCLLACVAIGGAALCPATFTAKIVAEDPARVATTTSQGTLTKALNKVLEATPKASQSHGSGGQDEAASARDWLPVAAAAVKKENSEAHLVFIRGASTQGSQALALDGKCQEWVYQYAAPADKLVYSVYVYRGVPISVSKTTPSEVRLKMGMDNEENAIVNWTVDSPEAVALANVKARELNSGTLPARAAYTLQRDRVSTGTGELSWHIVYYGSDSKTAADVKVDADTGDILSP